MFVMAKTYTTEAVLKVLAARIARSSLRKTAASLNISASYLSDIMRRKRDISRSLGGKLGFTRTVIATKTITFEKRV